MGQQKSNKILFVCNSTASRLWRVDPVALALVQKGYQVRVIDVKNLVKSDLVEPDLIVLEMVFDRKMLKELRKMKKKVAFEMDDMLTWLPKDHYAKSAIDSNWILNGWSAIRKSDKVIVSSEFLKKYYSWLRLGKSKIEIIPNSLYKPFWLKEYNENKTDIIRIGYVGGISHNNDLKILISPLSRILSEYPNVRFVTMGTGGLSSDNPLTEYNYGTDIFKDLPRAQREHHLGSSREIYPVKLYSLQLDIGLAPLVKNKFTKAKTPIKWMEYALNRTPSICQDFLYNTVIDHGVNGFLAKNEEEYYTYLRLLIEDRELRKKIGNQAYVDVLGKHTTDRYIERWTAIYESILNS